ncbi:hypothetical protein GCM10009772_15660 [Pseudonocardia alni subsp. carboxydivorans]
MSFLTNDLPCRDEDPELFFVTGPGAASAHQLAEAKAVCRLCPAAAACLEWALSTGQDFGVWGGLDEDERRALRREHTNSRACRASHRSARAQRRAAALDRIEQGDRPDDVATQIGVSRRTLDRWRADARTSA